MRVDRATKFGNPFVLSRVGDREAVIAKCLLHLTSRPELMAAAIAERAGLLVRAAA